MSVRDVLDEGVQERVLALPGDARATDRSYELATDGLVQPTLDLLFGQARHRRRSRPSRHLPDDGGVLQDRLLLGQE